MEGDPQAVCDSFYEQNDKKIKANIDFSETRVLGSSEIELIDLYFTDHTDQKVECLSYSQNCSIHFKIHVLEELEGVTFGFGFHTTDFIYLSTHNSEEQLSINRLFPGDHEITCKVNKLPLLPGIYSIRFGITAGQAARSLFYGESLKHFQIVGDIPITIRDGFFALDAYWMKKNIKTTETSVISTVEA
jgi:hypothetical protein